MAALVRYVNTASTVGTQDGTTNTPGNSGTAAFATLRQFADSLASTLTDQYTVYCSGSAADTGDVNQTCWDMTTSATNYIRIIGEQSPNHPNFSTSDSGKWTTSKYRITCTNRNGLYNNVPGHLRVEGVQVEVTVSDAGSYICFKGTNANQVDSDVDCRFLYCIAKGVQTSGAVQGFEQRPTGFTAGAGSGKAWNCLAFNCNIGFASDLVTGEFYNCTAADCAFGFVENDTNGAKVVNCLAHNVSGIGFVGTFATGSNFNAEDDGNGAPGANSHSATTFTFVNAASDDWHLAAGDTGAKDLGTSSVGGNFTDDIDGGTRTGSWDIGMDEQGVALVSSSAASTLMLLGVGP